MPARLFAPDQDRQLERVDEVERRQLLRGRLGDVLKGSTEDGAGGCAVASCGGSR